jgi:hypothetical protein
VVESSFVKSRVPSQGHSRLPEEVYREAVKTAGQHVFGLLLAEETWVHRRVEAIDMLSTQFLRRSVSVDFTIPEGIRDALAIAPTKQTLVPLATLAKRPLRNFDLRDEDGTAVPVLGRDHNGPLAHSTLLGVVRRALDDAGFGTPSQRLVGDLRRVAVGDGEEAERAISRMVEAAQIGGSRECQVVLNDDAALFLLADLAGNYVLVALCDDVNVRRVLKFSYEEPLETAKPGILERLGWRPLLVGIDVPGASRGASYHAEIVVPEELRFETSFLYDMDNDEVYAEDEEADRAALHAARVPLGARTALLFGLRAERTGFPVMGCTIAWITGLLLLAGATVGELDPERADSAATVLLAASAVFAGVIARSGEHRMVQALFAGPRLLLLVTALSALCAAGALAFGLSSCAVDIIWWITAVMSLTAAAMLTITLLAARPIAPGEL